MTKHSEMKKRSYYVSVVDGSDYRFLAGPFDTRVEALTKVEPARKAAIAYDRKAHFYGFGVAKAPAGWDKPGVFNVELGVAA